jgi:hypothetical protein
MPYKAGEKVNLTAELSLHDENGKLIKFGYKFIVYHRNNSSQKSQWGISCEEELWCFIQCKRADWIDDFKGWGIDFKNGNLNIIGLSKDKRNLYIIKFVDGNKNNNWHGYPADYMQNSQDKPPTEILKEWVVSRFINKANMSKIMRGQEI